MKYFFNIALLLSFGNCFSQASYADVPKQYEKIHFIYKQKSNYYVNEKGVFADTLLFQVDFPKLKFAKVISPTDSTFVCGFIELKEFNGQQKKELVAYLYHRNQKLEGEFNVAKNTTIITVERDDASTREVLKKYLKTSYSYFRYTITINYNAKTIITQYPLVEYSNDFKKASKEIVYNLNEWSGIFREEVKDFVFENKIILNDKFNNKIIPGQLFTNNSFGVEKIYTVRDTIELKSVSYK